MRVSDELIKEIIEKVNIVDVVSGYVKLEKKGKNFFGVCPFHDDTSPSMSVSNDKKIYKCFSCGASGDVINFIKEHDNLHYLEALKKAANIAGVTIELEGTDKKNEVNLKYYELTKLSKEFYKFYLHNTRPGLIALDYLYNRGLTQETIDRFEIGLSGDSYDYLHETLLDKGYDSETAIEAGLVKKGKSYYDLFRSRIIFPLHDEYGNVVGFSGRIYQDTQAEQPKYVNSPESIVFKKSEVLYNLDKAKNVIKRKDRVLLYEGFMDVISVVNAGLEESVATMGTSLSDSHVKKLSRLTKNLVICYDGDQAGINATNKTIDILRKYDFNVSVVVMPEGLDPDEYIKKYGSEKYLEHITNSTIDIVEFKYRFLKSSVNFNSNTDKERYKNELFKLISSFKSNSLLELYFKKVAKDLGVSVNAIESDFNSFNKGPVQKQEVVKNNVEKPVIVKEIKSNNLLTAKNMYEKADLTLTKYMLLDKMTAYYINSKLKIFYVDDINASIRYKIVDFYDMSDVSKIDVTDFVERLNDVQRMRFLEDFNILYTEVNQKEIDDCIKIVIDFAYKRKQDSLLEELGLPDTDEERKLQISNELIKLSQRTYYSVQ